MRSVTGIIDSIIVEIYERAVKDEAESEKQGVPIFNTSLYIKKRAPNSRDEYDQPVKASDRERYPDLFRAFAAGERLPLDGTPIEECSQFDAGEVQTIRSANILTVQDLSKCEALRFVEFRKKAQKWLNQNSEIDRLTAENKELKDRLDALEEKKKPGRPKKVA